MDKLKKTKQYEANLKLVLKLAGLIQQNPELRFGQILSSYGFIKEVRPAKPEICVNWQNEFYTQSEDILNRVEERCLTLNK